MMNPIRRRRLLWVLTLVAAAGIAAALVAMALQRNVAYLYTPSEVLDGSAGEAARFRLGGEVCIGSVQRIPGSLEVRFDVTDRIIHVPVHYAGILPDLFSEGTSIIATGRMVGGEFRAEQVLAKHDETYMPKEVANAMAESMARPAGHGCRKA